MDSARPTKGCQLEGANLSTGAVGNPENLRRKVAGRNSRSELRFAIEAIVKRKTRTEVNLEIHEEVALRAQRISMAECPVCGMEVRMIPANEAAMIAKVTARNIYELVNSGHLHFIEDSHGLLYICSTSLRDLRHPGEVPRQIRE